MLIKILGVWERQVKVNLNTELALLTFPTGTEPCSLDQDGPRKPGRQGQGSTGTHGWAHECSMCSCLRGTTEWVLSWEEGKHILIHAGLSTEELMLLNCGVGEDS